MKDRSNVKGELMAKKEEVETKIIINKDEEVKPCGGWARSNKYHVLILGSRLHANMIHRVELDSDCFISREAVENEGR